MATSRPARTTLKLDLDGFKLDNSKNDSEISISVSKSQTLSKISPHLTPNHRLQKILDTKAIPPTARSVGERVELERETSDDSKTARVNCSKIDLDTSYDFGKRLLKTKAERKTLEQQYQLMENRIKKLKDEDQKLKLKTKQTKEKTQAMIKNRERHLKELAFLESYRISLENSIREKQDKILRMKITEEMRKREKEKKLYDKKAAIVKEVKKIKQEEKQLKEEIKREEDIKNSEKMWKIAMHEKKLENAKMSHKLKVQENARKIYESKLQQEESRVEEVSKKMKELEKLEFEMLEKLRQTHNNHLAAYAEMQRVYESKPITRPMSPSSGSTTTTTSPRKKGNEKILI